MINLLRESNVSEVDCFVLWPRVRSAKHDNIPLTPEEQQKTVSLTTPRPSANSFPHPYHKPSIPFTYTQQLIISSVRKYRSTKTAILSINIPK